MTVCRQTWTHGRYLSEVHRTRYITHPTMRYAFVGFTTAYRLRRYHPDTGICREPVLLGVTEGMIHEGDASGLICLRR